MRKKFFLFIIAAFMATSSAWAQCIDSIPAPVYMANIQFDTKTDILSFNDVFHPDQSLNRRYKISIWYNTPGACLRLSPGQYVYGNYQIIAQNCTPSKLSKGGQQEFNLGAISYGNSDLISACYKNGYADIRIFIQGEYENNLNPGDWLQYEGNKYANMGFNNYVDAILPTGIQKLSYTFYVEENEDARVMLYGSTQALKAEILSVEGYTYKWEFSKNKSNWNSVKQGTIGATDARNGVELEYVPSFGIGTSGDLYYRLVISSPNMKDTSVVFHGQPYYSYTWDNGNSSYNYKAGEKITLSKPADCRSYLFESDIQVVQKDKGDGYIEITMPACPVVETLITPTYTVKFLNADYTLLKTVEVECGADATSEAPANPTYSTYTFIGWSQDLTNVHKNMSVLAKYDIGNTYWFDAYMSNHDNVVYPAEGFTQNLTRAMVGDQLTFTADVFAATNATIAYETALWDNNAQDYLWQKNGHITVAEYTTPNKEQFFDQTINVCYYPNNSYINPFQRKMAVRFIMFIAGQTIYSDPWEIDIYYPLFINAPEMDALFVENTAGDFNMGEQKIFIPAGYNDTVRLYSINGADGGCFSFGRLLYPDRRVENGVDEEGNAFIIGLGELDTISINVSEKLVVFDGVYGDGYPKQLDFTAEGFAKLNGYYGEVVPCGGSVTMPEDPTQENAIFLGWKAWSSDYADDAYLHVPSVEDKIIGFTAQWEDLPEVPQYKVRFYGKDGSPLLLDTLINEGENAVPPVAPEVSGYHFVGWDKPYTTITADVDITALYGEDSKTWTVTYYDADKTTKLGEETVNDGEAAQGIVVSAPDSYHLAKWMDLSTNNVANLLNVSKDMAVYAAYELNVYTITYTFGKTMQIDEGEVIGEELVKHGDMPLTWQSYESICKTGFEEEFGDQWQLDNIFWTPAIVPATQDATYDLAYVFSTRKFTVRFQNWDHTLLDEQQVEYGKSAVAPADPTRKGYTFKGWDREFNNIIADMTVTAVFEKNKEDKDTGIKDVQILPSEGVQKILHEGRLYIILPDGKVFNAQGVQVK